MPLVLSWLLTFSCALAVTLVISWSIFYPNYIYLISQKLSLFGYQFSSIWSLRFSFYLAFLPVHLMCCLMVYWIYSKAPWFSGKVWIISLTFLMADRMSATFWIWYFYDELPDAWLAWGMISLVFCIMMSAISNR